MSKFISELQLLKPNDAAQSTSEMKDYQGRQWDFITTAGHGYLVVPKTSMYYNLACKIVEYGFKGSFAVYLEEDCEIGEFFGRLPQCEAIHSVV